MLGLAIGSNIGAVSFVFSASLAGLLWRGILRQKGIHVKGWEFVKWNMLPLVCMTVAGCAVALAVVTIAPT
jgi:Na+/H+ antiporter NhaD/arsenite permease-like protein